MNSTIYRSIILISLVIMGLTSCKKDLGIDPSGKIIEDYRNITGFDGIVSENDYDVYIVETALNYTEVKIVADQNFTPYISTSLTGSTLHIKNINNHYFKGSQRVAIYITAPVVQYIELAGSGLMTCDSIYNNNMDVYLTGAGDISMYGMNATNLTAKIIGTGTIEMRGIADAADFEIPGSGKIYGYTANGRLQINDCSVKIQGSGDAFVYVWNNLNIYISGSGDVYYRNSPTISYNIPGSGRVIDDN